MAGPSDKTVKRLFALSRNRCAYPKCETPIVHRQPVESVETPKEALLVALNECGCVDLDRMAGLLNKPVEEFLPDLKGMIFRNPQTNEWETDDQYLSGNVREKLAVADAAAVTDPRFAENVEALKSVQPADLAATEIDVRLGSAWLPPEDVKDFTNKLLNIPSGVEVGHIHALGTWHINANWESASISTSLTCMPATVITWRPPRTIRSTARRTGPRAISSRST